MWQIQSRVWLNPSAQHQFCNDFPVTLTKKSQSSTWKAMSLTPSPCLIKCRPISGGEKKCCSTNYRPCSQHFISQIVSSFQNLPSFPGFSGDWKTNRICEARWGGSCVCGEDQWIHQYTVHQSTQYWFTLIFIPYPVWRRETPPLGCQSPSPCRPRARSPSYHSRRKLPAKIIFYIYELTPQTVKC